MSPRPSSGCAGSKISCSSDLMSVARYAAGIREVRGSLPRPWSASPDWIGSSRGPLPNQPPRRTPASPRGAGAAGSRSGSRVGHEVNKVFLPLAGRRVFTWSLRWVAGVPEVGKVILVIAERDRPAAEAVLAREAPQLPVELVVGGDTRHESEWAALQALAPDISRHDVDVVVIHDAARPLAGSAMFARVIEIAHAYGGALPVRPQPALVSVEADGAAAGRRDGRPDSAGLPGRAVVRGVPVCSRRWFHRNRHGELYGTFHRCRGPLRPGLGRQHQDHVSGRPVPRGAPARPSALGPQRPRRAGAMSVERAEFPCTACGQTAEHELRYAGRLLESTHCTNCGHVVELEQRVLLPSYLHDLEQRVVSKPGRMLRRVSTEGAAFVWELPKAVARQPVKFAKELWTVIKR